MSRKLLLSLVGLALCWSSYGQTAVYENTGTVMAPPAIPPNIDALNFVNRGQFIINFTNNTIPFSAPPIGAAPYETQNTLNYSNFLGHYMSFNTGLRAETFNP